MRKSIDMGCKYRSEDGRLVRTVCRAYTAAGDTMIAYVNVGDGGFVSDVYLLTEDEFYECFVA